MNYYQLTPDVITDALASVGIYVDSGLMALNSYENRVYRFKNDEQGPLVAKFYRPQRWTREQILEEHGFLQALADAGVRVAIPLRQERETLFEYQGIVFAVWPAVAGRQFETDSLEQLEALGEQLALLHQVGERFVLQSRPVLSTDDYLHRAYGVLEREAELPGRLRADFLSLLRRLVKRATELYRPGKQLSLHGDCHAGNLLWRDGPWLLDFDDCRRGPAVQDLWMMLSGSRQEQLVQLDTLLAGYETVREFDAAELALIEPLRAMRMVNYMAWLASRWSDPAFPANFPWFNTEGYWQQQIGTLEEQLQRLDAPPLSLTSWN
ncbi:stress response serine/threonine protein kinase YihE [Zobellella denitrificans]|uniref:Stress response kinase A n=1 Tax=Zobellella denitrificans TaxID=347534 RepID=A0A231MVH1_9GAMM|nr:serine/threonine protein kinase [Zobellella denitrificans]ATG75664.1 serine/threonine protein kinase [Zobellella denitrificans]OXS14217.1 stress response serine/threonine protein kinase YihE [Zobellella denitrificans]